MSNRTGRWLALLLGVTWGCSKLPPKTVTGALPLDSLPDSLTVPASWGTLTSATVTPVFPDVFQLWFQDSSGRIHLVIYRSHEHSLSRVAAVINRK